MHLMKIRNIVYRLNNFSRYCVIKHFRQCLLESSTAGDFSSKIEQIESLQGEVDLLNSTINQLQIETQRLKNENEQLIENKPYTLSDEDGQIKDTRIAELEKEREELESVYNTEKGKL